MKQPFTAGSLVRRRVCVLQAHAGHPLASPSTSSSVWNRCSTILPAATLAMQLVDQDGPRRGTCRGGGSGAPCWRCSTGYSASSTAVLPPPTTHLLAAVEEAVAGGAAAHAAAHEGLLEGRPRYLARAGGDDQRVAGVLPESPVSVKGRAARSTGVDVVEHDLLVLKRSACCWKRCISSGPSRRRRRRASCRRRWWSSTGRPGRCR